MILYAKIAAVAIAIGLAYWAGYDRMRDKHLLFVAEVKAVGEAAEAASKHAVEISAVITEGVKDEYETRIASIRAEYARRMRNNSTASCAMPSVPNASPIITGSADDPAIIGLCAEETAKLIALQKWIIKQQEARK